MTSTIEAAHFVAQAEHLLAGSEPEAGDEAALLPGHRRAELARALPGRVEQLYAQRVLLDPQGEIARVNDNRVIALLAGERE